MSQVTNIMILKVDDLELEAEQGTFGLTHGGIDRTPIMTETGVHYQEKLMPARWTATLLHMSDTDLARLRRVRSATLKCLTDEGPGYVGNNGFFMNSGELKGGKVTVTFGSDPVEQV